eukprot:gene7856-32473_t
MTFVHLLVAVRAATAVLGCHVTTADGAKQLAQCDHMPVPLNASNSKDVTWKLYADGTSPLQTIDGFGAAWTDATVYVFDTLSTQLQEELMSDLFSAPSGNGSVGGGLGLSIMRHTIGQSDLTPASIGEWSYDSNGGTPDLPLEHFNLTEPGEKMDNSLQQNYYDVWVEYFAWTMEMDSATQAVLANKLIPAIKKAGLATKIWAYDHNTDRPEYPQYILDNTNVTDVAWHCYAPGKPKDVWAPLSTFARKNPGVKQYMTECWLHLDTGESFFDLPTFIGMPLQEGASGSMAWTLGGSTEYDVSYPTGCKPCSGLVQVDMAQGKVIKTQDYYTLAHWSKFVGHGAKYLNTSGSFDYPDSTGVQANTFLNADGTVTVVIVNKIKNHLTVSLEIQTSADRRHGGRQDVVGDQPGGGNDSSDGGSSVDRWVAAVPARSVSTWVLPRQSGRSCTC